MRHKPNAAMRMGAAILGLVWLLGLPAVAQDTAPPPRAAGLLSAAIDAAQAGRLTEAMEQIAPIDPVAADLVRWQYLRSGHGTLEEFLDFLENNAHWPLINTVQRHAERLITNQSPEAILRFFANRAALSEDGQLAQVFALRDTGQSTEAAAAAERLWREEVLTGETELRLLRAFETALAPHHATRVDMLLWRGERNAALRHLDRINEGQRRVARARIALQERANGVNALIEAVPNELQTHPGLMHDRFEFRMRAGNTEGAVELILAQSRSLEGLGDPEAWGRRRVFLVRTSMSDGEFQRAYDLATPNGLDDGLFFVDLEFLAGFIALEYLDQPEKALNHFRALRVRSSSPISLGRAGFWEGRAHERLGDAISAQAAYEFGAEHQSSFYGQLAADRLGQSLDPSLIEGPSYPDWRATSLASSDLLQAALLLRDAGQWHEARRFIIFLARQLETEAELGALSDLMLALNEPNFALNVAKIAVQSEIVLPRAYFPLTDLTQADLPAPMDLVKAIARRESEFDPVVVSPADARGLMQVLPGTGQMMAQRLGVPFQPSDLTRNPTLNARLGAAYLAELRQEFGPSLALVAAGYNAGPGRPRQWIPRLGDPRDPSVDFINWVESVPFAETRNYIMRVAESLVVYRSRLAGDPQPIGMEALLRGR
ncbi:MAG: lytic transglycosylase domain-containing protein [Natronohydrobacter sp.]|nr:lytic transglycosylase domain-containing protein [Natronohydrobacter sp.]